MEIADLQQILNNTSQLQNEPQAIVTPTYKTPTHVYLFIYHPSLISFPLTKAFTASEGSVTHKFPYHLTNFVLRPTTADRDLEYALCFDENSAFGTLGQVIQVSYTSLGTLNFGGKNFHEIVSELKVRGDVQEISEETFKYLYKVADLEDGPILALSKSNTLFSGQATPKVPVETLKEDGRSLVEEYYRFLSENFGEEVGFQGLNCLRKGFEQSIDDGFLLKYLFDNYMTTLPAPTRLNYTFAKGSTDKLDFEIEIDKYAGGSLFKIPGLHEATGNFDWNHPKEFIQPRKKDAGN